uniref:Uncharacterized protein n=1 Tax=Rhizophora mucronata TaxID=61149 RepID=A0A2P2N6P2_RHIMU
MDSCWIFILNLILDSVAGYCCSRILFWFNFAQIAVINGNFKEPTK